MSVGVIYKDFKIGEGVEPQDGEQVTFAYTAYNESGGLIDSSYKQGRPAETRLGIQGLIPGVHYMVARLCQVCMHLNCHVRDVVPILSVHLHSSQWCWYQMFTVQSVCRDHCRYISYTDPEGRILPYQQPKLRYMM